MEPGKTTFSKTDGLVPNPKLRLREQLQEVMRFKQFSLRTEEAHWNWIRQFIFNFSFRNAARQNFFPAPFCCNGI
jgi:hypothetical protein